MEILKKIWAVINSRIFLVLLFVGALAFGLQTCSKNTELKRLRKIDEQNQAALHDSLSFEQKKNGEMIISINGYISSVKGLEEHDSSALT